MLGAPTNAKARPRSAAVPSQLATNHLTAAAPGGPAVGCPRPERSLAAKRGHQAEKLAEQYLESLGMRILARNIRVHRLEIDLLAMDGDVVCVVEVRSRGPSAYGSPFRSITWQKAKRVRSAGEALWRSRFRLEPAVARMRFDVVAITFDRDPPNIEHVRAAF